MSEVPLYLEFLMSKVPLSTRRYPGEQNKTLFKGFVRLRGMCSPLSGLHVRITMRTLLHPFYAVRLDNLVCVFGIKSEMAGVQEWGRGA